MSHLKTLIARMLGAGVILALASCSADPNRPQPVSGKVFFRKKPAEGALITFVPIPADAQAPRPTATVEKDGSFRLSTRMSFDGAPAGKYAVTIVYLSPDKKVDEQNAGPDLLKGKYSDPKTTVLKADIKPGVNELEPFELK